MNGEAPASDWRAPAEYQELFRCDRRVFAWEWLRRNTFYRRLWAARETLPVEAIRYTGLLALVDPKIAAPAARPIWSTRTDPSVLNGRLATDEISPGNLFDIRSFASFVSVEVDANHVEHWLLSDGRWAIRLDIHDGTLLGGPVLLEYHLNGIRSAKCKLEALRQFLILVERGEPSRSMIPNERRATRWILELRVGDAILAGASEQDIARGLFADMIAPKRWRLENASHRLRVQRLVRTARHRLAYPLSGPWFK